MDWHKLQHTLFDIDPTDPKEDLAKLRAQAQGGASNVAPTKDYVNESVEVPQGSMPLGLDSIADFAALAGVRLDEKQKMGAAGQAKGRDPMPKSSKPSSTGEQPHPLKDKLVGEAEPQGVTDFAKSQFQKGRDNYNKFSAVSTGLDKDSKAAKTKQQKQQPQKLKTGVGANQIAKMIPVDDQASFIQAIQKSRQGQALNLNQTKAMAQGFQKLMAMDPKETQRVMLLLKRMEAAESAMPKPRDPNSQTMQDIRKSGAAGAHKDKKKVLPRKEKHKGKQLESIKDMLYRKLAEK